MSALRRVTCIARHLSDVSTAGGFIQARANCTAAGTDDIPPYVPQYSNVEHPVLKTRRRINLLDSFISYLDTGNAPGAGDRTIIFLHGNPSSSYLWRNVILQVMGTARCIAPDLIGHGMSGSEPNNKYRMEDHYKYLCAFVDALNLPEKLNLVMHDWGAGVGLYWAEQHRSRVQSLSYFEAAIGVAPSWSAMSPVQQQVYGVMRSERANEFLNSPENSMMKNVTNVVRKLLPEEELMWKARFAGPGECRRPIVTWCREVPIKGDGPDDVIEKFIQVRRWLSDEKSIPKLYIDVTPGMLAPNNRVVTRKWHNQKVAHARGLHFAQEDDPVTIGNEIATFLQEDVYN